MILMEWKGVHPYPNGSIPFPLPGLEKVRKVFHHTM